MTKMTGAVEPAAANGAEGSTTTTAAAAAPTAAGPRPRGRRALFAAGLAGLIAEACSSKSEFSGRGAANAKGTDPQQAAGGSGNGNGAAPGSGSPDAAAASPSTPCDTTAAPKVNVGQTPVSADLKPTVKFYGRTTSALVAIQFSSKADIAQVLLAAPSGRLIALHGITGADRHADGSYRPIVIDNVWLKDAGADLTQLKIIIQQASGQMVHTEPVAFFTTYNGKPVIDLSQGTVPSGFVGFQSVARFADGNGTFGTGNFGVDNSVSYPNAVAGSVRHLQTVKSTSFWTPTLGQGGIDGTVTDIMGTVIDISGSGIIEHQLFCTYVDNGASVVRTMLHIG